MNRRQLLAAFPFVGLVGKRSSSPPLLVDGIPSPKFWFGDIVLIPFWTDYNAKPDLDVLEVWEGQVVGLTYVASYKHKNLAWHYFLKWTDGPSKGEIDDYHTEERYLAPLGTPEKELAKIAG